MVWSSAMGLHARKHQDLLVLTCVFSVGASYCSTRSANIPANWTEFIHCWMKVHRFVLLMRIPQVKLKQMGFMGAISIGERTEQALCGSNSLVWRPELFVDPAYAPLDHPCLYQFQWTYCHMLQQAGCTLYNLIRRIQCHFRIQSNLPSKSNAFEW